MDIFDRIEMAIRYWFLATMCLLGQTNTKTFQKQLRKVTDILITDENPESLRSEESYTCQMAPGTFEHIGDSELESHRAGEVFSEKKCGGNCEEQSHGRTYQSY